MEIAHVVVEKILAFNRIRNDSLRIHARYLSLSCLRFGFYW